MTLLFEKFGANSPRHLLRTAWGQKISLGWLWTLTEHISARYLPIWPSGQRTWPPCAVEHDALSGRGSRLSSGTTAYQRIIYNNSYAHDEQGVNPEQVRGFDGVFCKLWPSLMPWLAASMCQSCWRESQSRQMWLSFLAWRWRSVSQGWHWISASPGLASQ